MPNRQFLILFFLFSLWGAIVPGWAADPTGEVLITVQSAANEKPLPGATVTLTEINEKLPPASQVTGGDGLAHFTAVPVGDYTVTVTNEKFETDRTQIHVISGAPVRFVCYLDVVGGEKVLKVSASRSLIENRDPAGGNKIKMGGRFVETGIAEGRSLQAVLNTAPGMQSDANGQVHIRGEHKSLNFEIDGLNIPTTSANNYQQLFEPRFFDDLSIKLGNYESSEFGQLGAQLSLDNAVGKVTPYVDYRQAVGDHAFLEEMLKVGGSNQEGTFNYFLGARLSGTNLRTESPQPYNQELNNTGRDTNVMLRLAGRPSDKDRLGFTFVHQDGSLGVPLDTNSYLAGVRQNEFDHNDLAVLSWDHQFNRDDSLKLGLTYLGLKQRYTNNGISTPFTPISAAVSPELAASGLPADPTNPGTPYLPTSNLDVSQFQQQLEFKHKFSDRNVIKVGLNADFISSSQAVNVIDAGGGGGLPNPAGLAVPPTVFNANVARNGFFGGLFFSHSFPITSNLSLNYGFRADQFNNGLGVNTGQISPRVNLLWAPDSVSALRVSYNTLFQPPPLEIDVSGGSTALPQRTDQVEINYQREIVRNIAMSFGVVHKEFKNQLDVGLLIPNSSVPIFAPLNFDRAFYSGAEVTLNTQFKTGLNGFLSATYGLAKPTAGSLTEGPVPPPYNDHDQRYQIAGGVSESWGRGWSAETDFLFGTGYPEDNLNAYNRAGIYPYGINLGGGDGRTARFIANLSLSYKPVDKDGKPTDGPGAQLQIYNLFDNRSNVNFYSAFSGTRFTLGRRIILNGIFHF